MPHLPRAIFPILCRVAGIVLCFVAQAMAAPLPEAVDVPAGPPGVALPADREPPRLSGGPEVDAPAISMIGDVTLPGETLVITGDGLENAKLRIWSEGGWHDVEPLRSAADRMQAVVPEKVAPGTMLVWPMKGEKAGAPIRVNGATAWWAWPARVAAEEREKRQTVRIFGKSLKLEGAKPRVYFRGEERSGWLEVEDATPYHLEALLPENLPAGHYEVWAHNGTGDRYGWSEAVAFEAVRMPTREGQKVFAVADFGAKADSGEDAWAGIDAAVRAAAKAGGGVVRFEAGVYMLSRTIDVPEGGVAGIHLVGAGRGEHGWRNLPEPNDHKVEHEISGQATVLRSLRGEVAPKDLLRIGRRYSSVRDLTLLTHADKGKQRCLLIAAHDIQVDNIRGIVVDERPRFTGWDKPEAQVQADEVRARLQDEAVVRIDAPGKANIVIENSEFHHPGAGIDTVHIRAHIGHAPESGICPPGTDFIRISDCTFRGYFDGRLEPWLKDRRFQGWRGWHNFAWLNEGSKNVIVERCDAAGADKNGFKVMTRFISHGNTSIRDQYLAHNRGRGLAPTSASPGYHENKGELILFHLWYPQGGLFDVLAAGGSSVSINTSDPKFQSGRKNSDVTFQGAENSSIPKDIGANPTHWVVFICAGRGVGQYRVVSTVERRGADVTLHLERPWRVLPDASSRFTLNAAYRRNIVAENDFDAGPGEDPLTKSHGVVFWGNSFENVIVGNELGNLTGGVVINAFFRSPTGWNLTTGNRFRNIRGNGGDTVFPGKGAFYVDHVRVLEPKPEDRVWYSVGNIARSNEGDGADVAAYLHRPDYARIDPRSPHLPAATRELLLMPRGDNTVVNYRYPETPEGGIMMPLLEHNVFRNVGEGLVISSPLNWPLFRDNRITGTDGATLTYVDEGKAAGGAPAREILWQ